MPLPLPNLDDRNFDQLVANALDRISKDLNTPWTDLSPGDPGVVMLEAFAFLTEQMLYRLNRLPEKVYIAYLSLLGVSLEPPTAASVELAFWQSGEGEREVELPRGTRVTTAEGAENDERPVFITAEPVKVPAAARDEAHAVQVRAFHCELVEEELGESRGVAGQVYRVRRPPIVARLPEPELALKLGVEVSEAERRHDDLRGADGKFYRRWTEVENFADISPDSQVYVVERFAGTVQFAPAARLPAAPEDRTADAPAQVAPATVAPLGAVPPAGRKIRIWYPRGGGEGGNLARGKLNTLLVEAQGALPAGLQITNPRRAAGGLAAESLENALIRGPRTIYAQRRAVTAREFEQIASRSPYVARARAFTQAGLWRHAAPGTVEIVLVPRLPEAQRRKVQREDLEAAAAVVPLDEIEGELDDRRPLGTHTQLRMAGYKKVWVEADLTVGGNEAPKTVSQRVIANLNALISPLPVLSEGGAPGGGGMGRAGPSAWPFGQRLRVGDIYRSLLDSEKNLSLITSLKLVMEHAPDQDVRSVAADFFQPATWFAGSGSGLYRTICDGEGWERVGDFSQPAAADGEGAAADSTMPVGVGEPAHAGKPAPAPETSPPVVRHVRPSPYRPGLVVAMTEMRDAAGRIRSPLYLSLDCGEEWQRIGQIDHEVEDLAWMRRGDTQVLLLATDGGLFAANLDIAGRGHLRAQPTFQLIPVLSSKAVDPAQPAQLTQPGWPTYAVTVLRGEGGSARVAVALKGRRGIYLSRSADLVARSSNPVEPAQSMFDRLGLEDEDIRHLNVQYDPDHGRLYLWAGAMALADRGQGCYRWPFDDSLRRLNDGAWIGQGWDGGSCLALAFHGARVYAVSAWRGVLSLQVDFARPERIPTWQSFAVVDLPLRAGGEETGEAPEPDEDTGENEAAGTGLPRRITQLEERSGRRGIFMPLAAIAANGSRLLQEGDPAEEPQVLVGGPHGLYASRDGGQTFYTLSAREFTALKDAVTIPPNWLLVSGDHSITVQPEAEASGAFAHEGEAG